MSLLLQGILIACSVLVFIYMFHKIRKSQIDISDSIFWIVFSVILFIISVFPQIPILFSKAFGVQSPVNFIFLTVIFLLIIKVFLLSVKISFLENKIKTLAQEMSISDFERSDETKK